MKKILVLSLTFLVCSFGRGLHGEDSVPGGKNILNPAIVETDRETDSFRTTSPLAVEAGTPYTFSMIAVYQNDIRIASKDGTIHIDENVSDPDVCLELDDDRIACTFTPTSEAIQIEVSEDYAAQYYSHHGADEIELQLEEGETATSYAPYEAVYPSDPEFSGSGLFVMSYEEATPIEDIVAEHITAYDEIDGDLSDEIVIAEDAYTGNEDAVGEYPVRLEVSDSSGNTAYFDLTIIVKDEIPPKIEGPSEIVVDVDETLSLETIIEEHFHFYDDHDGIITDYEIITDDYSAKKDVLGAKEVEIRVTDESENETEKLFTIDIVDVTPPVIEGPEAIEILLSDPSSLEEILSLFTPEDNHTPTADMEITTSADIEDFLYIAGEHTMHLYTEDASGNQAEREVSVIVIDDVPPVIGGMAHMRISYTESLDVDALREELAVSDNHDTLTTDDIFIETNTVDEGEVGVYEIVFAVKDAALNKATHKVVIEIIDDAPPEFGFSDEIVVTTGASLSEEDILAHLRNRSGDDFEPVEMKVLEEDYSDNKDTPGDYSYIVELRNEAGENETRELTIRVSEPHEDKENNIPVPIAVGGLALGVLTGFVIKRKFR